MLNLWLFFNSLSASIFAFSLWLFVVNTYILLNFILFFVIFGFITYIICLFFFKKISFNYTIYVFVCYWYSMFLLSIVFIINLIKNLINKNNYMSNEKINFYKIIDVLNLKNHMFLVELDVYSVYFLFTIAIISLFANIHTYLYMKNDQKKEKFVMFLNGFAFSMVGLIISKHFFLIIFFWELLGMTSFFLIKHNDIQNSSKKSAFKAFIYNKLSDFFIIITFVICLSRLDSLNITNDVVNKIITNTQSTENIIGLQIALIFLFIAACVKSVQFFTFFWLPDSMKAPAPASALIHSATLVAAGFYLIVTFKDLYLTYLGLEFMLMFGLITAIVGSITACFHFDLKKILAFSTIANCGFMLSILATGDINLFFIYFILHGILKSLCFMLAGNIIVLQNHEQDVRNFKLISNVHNTSFKTLMLLIFCLSGAPIAIMYIIKHSLIITSQTEYVRILYDTLSYAYGFMSILYAINFSIKVFFNISLYKKNYNKLHVEHRINVFKLLYIITICFVFFLSILYCVNLNNALGARYDLNFINISKNILYNMLPAIFMISFLLLVMRNNNKIQKFILVVLCLGSFISILPDCEKSFHMPILLKFITAHFILWIIGVCLLLCAIYFIYKKNKKNILDNEKKNKEDIQKLNEKINKEDIQKLNEKINKNKK